VLNRRLNIGVGDEDGEAEAAIAAIAIWNILSPVILLIIVFLLH
jgi:hypothetical protein